MDPRELSSQLKKPTGTEGREVAEALNESNQKLYEQAFEIMPLNAGDDVLEIGFGNGNHFPDYFKAEPEMQLSGVDFSADMCEEARSRNSDLLQEGKLSVQCAEASSLPFPDHMFDLAVALNVIYFFDPPDRHLREIHRVLKPAGEVLIGYRPRHSVEHLEFTLQNFILYEADELCQLFEASGFEIILEKTNSSEKKAVDGTTFTVEDSFLLAKSTY